MTTTNIYSACIDCTAFIENGEFNPDYSDIENNEIVRSVDKLLMFNKSIHYTGHEIGFSWNCCDICNRRTAGNRYQIEGI